MNPNRAIRIATYILVISALFILWFYPGLPDQVPSHFNVPVERTAENEASLNVWGKEVAMTGYIAISVLRIAGKKKRNEAR